MLINRKGPTQSSIANIFETVGVDSFGDAYEYELKISGSTSHLVVLMFDLC